MELKRTWLLSQVKESIRITIIYLEKKREVRPHLSYGLAGDLSILLVERIFIDSYMAGFQEARITLSTKP